MYSCVNWVSLLLSLKGFLRYSGYKTIIKYVISKYFLLWVVFTFLDTVC